MFEWLDYFANPNFMPHGHCYLWRPDILWTHVIADLVVATAYYTIPVVLGLFLYKRRGSIPYPEILSLFVAFIFLCGTTHLVSIYVTWYPAYEYQGWLKAVTALISIITAIVLIPKLPELIAMPGMQQAYNESEEKLRIARIEKEEMEALFNRTMDRESRILLLKEEVNNLLAEANQAPRYLLDSVDKKT